MPWMYFELSDGRVLHKGDTISEEEYNALPECDKVFFSPEGGYGEAIACAPEEE